jgi:hypothetical protein
MTVLISAIHEWYCPACGATDQTKEVKPHTRFHVCPKLRFLTAPMLPRGTSAKVELNEREDYIGRELVQLDPEQGRPVMNMVTTRDEGTDCMVYAPTATARTS